MKKTFALILTGICLLSFSTDQKLKVEGDIQDWNNVMGVIEQSNAPHLQVMAAKEFLVIQLNAQLDTTKQKK